MLLTWKPNVSTSALHTAEACCRSPGRITDPEVLATMRPYAERLGKWIDENLFPESQPFWDTLIATGSAIDSNRELASAVLSECGRGDLDLSHSPLLAGLITDVEAAFRGLFPQYIEQSSFRFRPLQEQWLGFGRGLMSQWKRLTHQNTPGDPCTVIGLQPVLGGFGRAHPDRHLVRIEAVLTNARSELPEVVRLGWLISQLELEFPAFIESSNPHPANVLLPLATIPSILAAAEEIELTRCDRATLAAAIEIWQVAVPIDCRAPNDLAPRLLEWWQSQERADVGWQAGLQILANQLGV